MIGELHLFLICIDMVDFEPWVEMMMSNEKEEEEEQGDRHKSSSWRECGESPSTSLSSSKTHSSLHITPGHQNSGTCSDTISS